VATLSPIDIRDFLPIDHTMEPRHLRLALSMNGGVSLAVWIAGAVAEIDELRRGDGFWGDVLEAAGYRREAQVDVMAGASAGGLNAVMLATSIQANRPFSEFFPLWLDAADIHELVKPPSVALDLDDRAVLNGNYFLRQLHDALARSEAAAEGEAPTHPLAVFASATLVRGNAVAFRDAPGEPIHETRSDAYFHVDRRGPGARGLDGFADVDGTVPNLTALAMIGRATSSLPALFEPMKFDRASFGSRLVGAFRDDRPTVEIMDGGVIDNVPIARAIRAIFHIPATGRTRRVVMYLHPDPGGSSTDRPAPEPSNAIRVALAAVGKRAETIREDVELLRQHNDAVRRRDAQARIALQRLLDGAEPAPASAVSGQVRAIVAATLLRAAIEPDEEMHWHAPGHPRLAALLDAPGSTATKDDLADAFRDAANDNPNVLVADRIHRAVAALQRIARMAVDESPSLDLSTTLDGLNELQLLCHLVTSYQLAAMLNGSGDAAQHPVARLTRSTREITALTISTLDDTVWRGLATWHLPEPTPGGRPLMSELDQMLDRVLASVPQPTNEGLGCRVLHWLAEQPNRAVAARGVADALLDLRAEPVASDQHIDFVRVAGNVDTWASRQFMGDDPVATRRRFGDRIAGKQLHHLGAFFDRRWRANDLRWGRLDSVPALLDAVLDDDAVTHLRNSSLALPEELRRADSTRADIKEHLLRVRQQQLLDEMAKDEPFEEWRRLDRRLVSLLGGRRLTSSAMQASITATRVAAVRQSRLVRALVTVLRPLVLAVTGVALAGRWATSALAWTVCVLAAARQGGAAERWVWWYVGTLVCMGLAALVEGVFKPVHAPARTIVPYALAVAGVVVGGVFAGHHDWLVDATPSVHIRWVWLLPAVAAAIAAVSLFFWMAAPAAIGMSLAAGAWYGWIAYAAHARQVGIDLRLWPDGWPFHSMWIAWVLAILGLPVLVSHLPPRLLSPRSPRR
jgi:predicted acylesterase/phospholipase RssA